ncbi:MAG TPA: TIM-barrel domain-containing protein [Thermomicrobiales bacterium]|nr:TIM-barrel domain-containing protein [Thermomicrobiales bacterium]
MTSGQPSRPLTIVHAPTGIDHPYETRYEERRPRDPIGGDMVSVGFLTTPGGAAAGVRVDWERAGQPQAPIHARATANATDEDRWLAELGVIEAGESVTYRISATGHDGATVRTADYGFVTATWHRLAGAEILASTPDRFHVRARDASGAPGPAILVTSGAEPGTLQLTVQPGSEDQRGAGTPSGPLASAGPVSVTSGAAALGLDPATGRITMTAGGRETGVARLRWLSGQDDALLRVELTGSLAEDERLVGFGERFDALDQRGRTPGVAVYEQYKNQGDRTYFPVPFFLSSTGYGVLVAGTAPVAFDLGRTIDDRWRCLADVPATAGTLGVTLFAGPPREMVAAMTALTGRPAPPPAWVFGPWMSSNEWNTQARVEREVAATQELGIPATVMVIEAWSDETTFYVWNGAEYTATGGDGALSLADFHFPSDGPWPDPQGMTDELHASGIRLVLWQIPVLKAIEIPHPQHDADIAHAVDRGYVFRDSTGAPYRNPAFWFRDALVPDLADDEVADWWMSRRRYLLDEMGIDGFKTDGGEHLSGRGVTGRDGRRGDEAINGFPAAYIGAYHRYAQAHRAGDAVTFSRAGHTGAGAFPAHWAGDENSTWEAYRRSIVAGLTAGLSGVPFWSWDIAGFSDDLPGAELYLRATAMATFCPIMQYHSEYNPAGPSRDRTPWNIATTSGDDRVLPLARHFHRLRMSLIPYLIEEAAHAARTGEPMMRPLLLDYPDDPVSWAIQDQYCLGRDLLVAPVVTEGATERRLYLPAGDWYGLWDGTCHEGGQWLVVPAPIDSIPVFVRAGAAIPLHLPPGGHLGDDVGNGLTPEHGVSWRLFPCASGLDVSFAAAFDTSARVRAALDVGNLTVAITGSPVPTEIVLPDGRRQSPGSDGTTIFRPA